MLVKIFYLVYFLLIYISYGQILHLPLKNKNKIGDYFFQNIHECSNFIYKNGFKSDTYITGNIAKSDKVDIFICNHINYLDFWISAPMYSKITNNAVFLYSNYLDNFPIIGRLYKNSSNISLNKKIEKDKDNIINNIKKINNGLIALYPEGTRISSKKIFKSQKYSKENNLHIYDNLLYPKMKGLYTIIEVLHKQNKLGNIIDCTIKIDGLNIDSTKVIDFITNDLKNTYINFSSYKARYFQDYEKFKKW